MNLLHSSQKITMKRLMHMFFIMYIFSGCNTINKVKNQLSGSSPHEKYAESLSKAGLNKTALGKNWKNASQEIFNDSVVVNIPFSEVIYFGSSDPDARSFKFKAKEGQVLVVKGTLKSKAQSQVFIDLFIEKDSKWKHVAFADSSLSLKYEFRDEADCILRVQPELLVDVYLIITVTATPVLINPVLGASNKSIGSFYGDVREGGVRKHEGVDIFAPKGTPVVAPSDGYVSRIGNTKLGGKIVWMYDLKRNHAYYFAHLDQQLTTVGKISQGDTIGTVGNTGNAKSTPPHLHFGIYQSRSKDPIYYIRTMETAFKEAIEDTSVKDLVYKTSITSALLFAGPGSGFRLRKNLLKNSYVKVIGYNLSWFRVQLPDGKEGYVTRKSVSPASKGKLTKVVQQSVLMTEAKEDAVPIKYIKLNQSVEVLAENEGYKYVRDESGTLGWMLFK